MDKKNLDELDRNSLDENDRIYYGTLKVYNAYLSGKKESLNAGSGLKDKAGVKSHELDRTAALGR